MKKNIILSLFIFLLIIFYTFKNSSFLIRYLSAIGFIIIFVILDLNFKIGFKKRHYLFIIIISITSFLLSSMYFLYPQYDKFQHLIQPILFSSIIFFMISKLKLELKWKLTFTFFIMVGLLSIFELGEYILDYFFNLKLQGVFLRNLQGLEKYSILMDRNDDTMADLGLGIISSLIYVIIGLIFRKKEPL